MGRGSCPWSLRAPPRVLMSEAWPLCCACSGSGLDGRPQPTSLSRPESDPAQGTQAGLSGHLPFFWILRDRPRAGCPRLPAGQSGRPEAAAWPPPAVTAAFSRPPRPGAPSPQRAPLHATALLQPPGSRLADTGAAGITGAERGPAREPHAGRGPALPSSLVSTVAALLSPRSGRFWGVRLRRRAQRDQHDPAAPRAALHPQAGI